MQKSAMNMDPQMPPQTTGTGFCQGEPEAWVHKNPLGSWCYRSHLKPQELADTWMSQRLGIWGTCQESGALEVVWNHGSHLGMLELIVLR